MNQSETLPPVGTMTCRELALEEESLAARWRAHRSAPTDSDPYPFARDVEVTTEIVRRVNVGAWQSFECRLCASPISPAQDYCAACASAYEFGGV